MPKFNPENFPIILKVIDGYLVVSAPEFGLHLKKKFDRIHRASDIGVLYLDMVKKIAFELKTLEQRKKRIPSPKRVSSDEAPFKDATLSVKQVSTILGLSEDTVRRMADDEKIACRKTPGGHRRFSARSVEALRRNSNS